MLCQPQACTPVGKVLVVGGVLGPVGVQRQWWHAMGVTVLLLLLRVLLVLVVILRRRLLVVRVAQRRQRQRRRHLLRRSRRHACRAQLVLHVLRGCMLLCLQLPGRQLLRGV